MKNLFFTFITKLIYSQITDDKINSLKYCTTCHKAWKLSAKKGQKACLKCKTNFRFKCEKCLRVYARISSLNSHINGVCNVKPRYYCDHCDHKAHFKYRLADHIQRKHSLFPNDCTKCKKKFSSAQSLQRHIKICGVDEKSKAKFKHLSCDHCSFKTDQKLYLTSHIHWKHFPNNPKLHKCEKCKKCYAERSSLRKHLIICSSNWTQFYVCDVCHYKTHYKHHLSRHKKLKHFWDDKKQKPVFYPGSKSAKKGKPRKKKIHKDFCPFKATLKSNLADHIYAKHFRDPNLNKCKKCQKNFASVGYFRRHLKFCGQDSKLLLDLKRFCCDHCDYKTFVKNTMIRHIRAKHLPRDPNLNKCVDCKKSYKSRDYLRRHLKICKKKNSAHSSFRLRCDHCEYSCEKKKDFVRHMQLEHMTEVVVLTDFMINPNFTY